MKKIRLTAIAAIMTAAMTLNTGCDDLFDPAIENHKGASALEELPAWAVGMLGHAYISNPLGAWSFNDVATDDAVSNDPKSNLRIMATVHGVLIIILWTAGRIYVLLGNISTSLSR